ncbi:MAG: heme lyase CcmF/NrfE family subunit, partial [Microvirga sp.]
GSHEGSILLWALVMATWTGAVALRSRHLPRVLIARVLGIMGLINAGLLLFVLFTSNPFVRMLPGAPDGRDLNPLLQDPGMVFHPPILYTGYVGFSVAFAFAVAALLEGRLDAAWARWSRPWTTAAWCFLTCGICLGSFWAYYELGWGGWWFWDPVENASFMPWLVGTALLHSAVVMEKRNALKLWTILLSILAFSLSLLGTFLVRSGVLTSVHSFATDPTRGVFILAILVLFIGGSLALYAWRAPLLKQGGLFAPISREGMLVLNNLFLTTACATVFTGTLYPLALEALTGAKISVGAPYFNLTFAPLFLPLLVAVPFGPLMAWKRGDLLGAGQRLFGALALAILAVAASFAIAGAKSMLAPFVIGLAFFVMAGAVSELAERTQLFRVPAASALARARGLPRSAWGTALAHFGLGVSLLGIVCETQWGAERIASVKPGQTLELRGYELRFDGLEERQGPNYRELAGRFTVSRNGETIAVMEPAKRSFPARENATTEAALMTRGFSQLYLSLGDPGSDGAINVRLYHKPLVLLIWLGAVVMALGGALSLSDRRLRVGAPKPARMKRALQPAE